MFPLDVENQLKIDDYTRARKIVKSAGKKIGIDVKPHDLRRHAATYASRSGIPIEIVSKIILRHSIRTPKKNFSKLSLDRCSEK